MHARALFALLVVAFALAAQASGPTGARRAQLVHMVRTLVDSFMGVTS